MIPVFFWELTPSFYFRVISKDNLENSQALWQGIHLMMIKMSNWQPRWLEDPDAPKNRRLPRVPRARQFSEQVWGLGVNSVGRPLDQWVQDCFWSVENDLKIALMISVQLCWWTENYWSVHSEKVNCQTNQITVKPWGESATLVWFGTWFQIFFDHASCFPSLFLVPSWCLLLTLLWTVTCSGQAHSLALANDSFRGGGEWRN